jgi:hypothetical protein
VVTTEEEEAATILTLITTEILHTVVARSMGTTTGTICTAEDMEGVVTTITTVEEGRECLHSRIG